MGFQILEYVDGKGKSPFRSWLDCLDTAIKARIQARILRFEGGNLGDVKSVGDGVLEARYPFGSGYRLYFGVRKRNLIILLLGGDKRTQGKDIRLAKKYWVDYLEANRDDKTK